MERITSEADELTEELEAWRAATWDGLSPRGTRMPIYQHGGESE